MYATNLHKTQRFSYVSFSRYIFFSYLQKWCDEDDVLAASAAFIVILSATNVALLMKSRRRRFWVRSRLLHDRKKYGATDFTRDPILDDQNLLSLEYRSGEGFRNFFQMSGSTFEEILDMIVPRMTRKLDTRLRNRIPIHKRLAYTLRFLASEDSYHSPKYLLKISEQTMSQRIPEVCDAIIETIKEYIIVSNKPSYFSRLKVRT